MPRLRAVDPREATGKAKELLERLQATLGMTPNFLRAMAQSPALLEAYRDFSTALGRGELPATLREQIALTVAEINGCAYCLALHTAVGKMVGLSEEDTLDSRRGVSPSSKIEAALQFSRKLVETRGRVTDEDVTRIRRAGYGEAEIAEMVANVVLNTFDNYFNLVAETVVDFPHVPELSIR